MYNEQPTIPEQAENNPVSSPAMQPVSNPPVMPTKNKSKMKFVVIILLVIVFALAGTVAWLLLKDQNNTAASTTNANTTATTADTTSAPVNANTNVDLKTTDLTYGTTTVSVQHPQSWSVVDTTEQGSVERPVTLPGVYIKSDKGHYLHLFAVDGIGGTCEPNSDSYTLTKRLSTKVSDIYFVQYTAVSASKFLSIQQGGVPAEGFTGTDTCTNLSSYGMVHAAGDNGGVYVTVSNKTDQSLEGTLMYSDISSDPEFVAMLQSLTVK